MKQSSIYQPITAWIIRFLDWDFQDFKTPVMVEIGQRYSVKFVRARRASRLDRSEGEIMLTLENYLDKGKDDNLKKNLIRLVSARKKIIETAVVTINGDLLFKFTCTPSERPDYIATNKDGFFNYKRDESQYLFEAINAIKEVFEILGINQENLRGFKLREETIVVDDDGTWIGLEKFLGIKTELRT